MLNQMRALSQNWIGRSVMAVVLGFIIVSFAVWGIGDRFNNFNASELAKVGKTSISVDAYRNAYQTQLQQIERSEKRGITNDEARQMGLDRQVLARLLSDVILEQEAKTLGLAVGDSTIAKTIMNDPAFKGQNGQFDRAKFEFLMRDNGFTEARYVKLQRETALRNEVSDSMTGGLKPPEIMTSAVHRFKAEVRDFDYFVLPPSAAGTIPSPTDAELKSFYDSRSSNYAAPEYRKLVVLSIVPSALVKPDAVTDDEVKKRYEDVKAARFVVPEKRTVQQLVFPNAAAADAAKAKIDGGESFDKLVTDEKKSSGDVSLGTVAKSEIADPAVADAAFALPDGGTSKPVKGQFGSVLVHVSKIDKGSEQPLMEVSAQLKDEMAIIKARSDAARMRDKIEDERTAGKTLTEAAATVGLKPTTIPAVDAQGQDKDHKPVANLKDQDALLKVAFATEVGSDTEMLQTNGGGNAWYEVAGIEQAHVRPLSEVKSSVEADWRQAETDRRLATLADKLVTAINGGKSLADVAADNGKLQVMKAEDVGRGGAPNLVPRIASAVFAVPVGKAGSANDKGSGRMIFKVEAAHVPPVDPKDEDFKKIVEQVNASFQDDVLSQYLAQLQSEIGLRINQQALQTALGGDSGS